VRNKNCHQDFDADGKPIPRYQDAYYGRDSNQATNSDMDGKAGFSFTKIGKSGQYLPNTAQDWTCVLDNVTGLLWEVKTNDDSLHDWDDDFTWYNSNGSENGGNSGTRIADSHSNSCFGFSGDSPSTYCNTQDFVTRVNTERLCGQTGWRLPTAQELISLLDYEPTGQAHIDHNYFPLFRVPLANRCTEKRLNS